MHEVCFSEENEEKRGAEDYWEQELDEADLFKRNDIHAKQEFENEEDEQIHRQFVQNFISPPGIHRAVPFELEEKNEEEDEQVEELEGEELLNNVQQFEERLENAFINKPDQWLPTKTHDEPAKRLPDLTLGRKPSSLFTALNEGGLQQQKVGSRPKATISRRFVH